MKNLKVIQIIDQLHVGGAEVMAVNIANGLSEKGVVSHLCVTREEGDLKDNISPDIGYVFLKKVSTFDLKAIFKLKAYIKKHQIHIVHAHSTSFFLAFLIKVLLGKQIDIFWHNHSGSYIRLKGFKFFILKFCSNSFKTIINVNEDLKDWSVKKLKHKRALVLNNFAFFSDETATTTLKGNKGERIVCLAGFREEKDHLTLLKAFNSIVKQFPQWTLHLIGKDYKDEYSQSIKEYILKEKLANNVHFYGKRPDIKHILSQADIGVLSSKSEGLPISLLEYGLAKLPVLVTDVGECSSVVNNKNAIVPKNRSDIFAASLIKLIQSIDLRKEVSDDLHTSVITQYSKKSFMNTLINVYTS